MMRFLNAESAKIFFLNFMYVFKFTKVLRQAQHKLFPQRSYVLRYFSLLL